MQQNEMNEVVMEKGPPTRSVMETENSPCSKLNSIGSWPEGDDLSMRSSGYVVENSIDP